MTLIQRCFDVNNVASTLDRRHVVYWVFLGNIVVKRINLSFYWVSFFSSSDNDGNKNVGELGSLKIATSLRDTFENLSKPSNVSVNQNPAKIAPLRKTHSLWNLIEQNNTLEAPQTHSSNLNPKSSSLNM